MPSVQILKIISRTSALADVFIHKRNVTVCPGTIVWLSSSVRSQSQKGAGVGVTVTVGMGVAVGIGVSVTVGVGVEMTVGVGVRVGVIVTVGVGVSVGMTGGLQPPMTHDKPLHGGTLSIQL